MGGEYKWRGVGNPVEAWEHILEDKWHERVHSGAEYFVLFPSMVGSCTLLEFTTLWGISIFTPPYSFVILLVI